MKKLFLFLLAPALMSSPVTGQTEIPANAIVVRIEGNGALRLNQEAVEYAGLSERLRAISTATTDQAVVVVSPGDADFQQVVRIIEAAKAAGIERIGILKSQPQGPTKLSRPPGNATVLSLDRAGVLRLDGRKINVRDIRSQLQRILKQRNDRTVFVQAYRSLSFETVAGVIDAAKAAGAAPIGLLSSDE
jgi:biopolymer transport protein ExbD